MDKVISCEFNMDTACVELKYADGSMISIDCTAVENEVADNMYQRSELDWLISHVGCCGCGRCGLLDIRNKALCGENHGSD